MPARRPTPEEIGRRSARDLGYDGLAQRRGARNAEDLVQKLTGTTAREAQTLVSVGSMLPVEIRAMTRSPRVPG